MSLEKVTISQAAVGIAIGAWGAGSSGAGGLARLGLGIAIGTWGAGSSGARAGGLALRHPLIQRTAEGVARDVARGREGRPRRQLPSDRNTEALGGSGAILILCSHRES
jgi:hypothetical protein